MARVLGSADADDALDFTLVAMVGWGFKKESKVDKGMLGKPL